eukprot:gene22158-25112_t
MSVSNLSHFDFVKSEFTVGDALQRIQSAAIFRSLSICDKLLSDSPACLELFRSLALAFNEDMTDNEIEDALKEAARFRTTITVESLRDAYMQCLPNKGNDESNNHPHAISFNNKYLSYDCEDEIEAIRCTFLLLVKELHEHSHTLTPSFARRTVAFKSGQRDLNTPEKLGAIWRTQRTTGGDAGSAWEALTFGGRVLAAPRGGNCYANKLHLLLIEDPAAAPTAENSTKRNISDNHIRTLLDELERWVSGSPIPILSLMNGLEETEESDGPARKKTRKNASESGGMHLNDCTDFFSSSYYDLREGKASTTSAENAAGTADATSHASNVITTNVTSSAGDRGGAPRIKDEQVGLSDEEYQEWVKVGQAMSPEMQTAWMTGNVKF